MVSGRRLPETYAMRVAHGHFRLPAINPKENDDHENGIAQSVCVWSIAAFLLPVGGRPCPRGGPHARRSPRIAKEAYIYGFPLVDSYRIQYSYFVDRQNPEFKASWNQIVNIPRVYTPADTAIQTPNSDTPYSWLGMDLRAEPMVSPCR
jgi:hypothetical protein